MQQHQQQQAVLRPSRSQSRLSTPSQQHGGRALHSSGGMSESGDFESEVNELLGWAQTVAVGSEEPSPTHARHAGEGQQGQQVMRVHY